MNLKVMRFLAVSTLGLTFSSIGIDQVKATTLIGNIVNSTTEAAQIGLCTDINICSPGDTLDISTSGSPINGNNDTGFPITDILYTIAPGQDAIWDLATSVSDIFDITIFNNGTQMLLDNGVWGENQVIVAERITTTQSPNDPDPVDFSFTINSGVATPEPLTILGTATALGFASLFKRKNTFLH